MIDSWSPKALGFPRTVKRRGFNRPLKEWPKGHVDGNIEALDVFLATEARVSNKKNGMLFKNHDFPGNNWNKSPEGWRGR